VVVAQQRYKVVVGETKDINHQFIPTETLWKPLMMSVVPNERVPGGVILAVIFERVTE
jgi:hypothetical protein